jgi:chromosome segregation ATPase
MSDGNSRLKLTNSIGILQQLVEHLESTTQKEVQSARSSARAEFSREIERLEAENEALKKQVRFLEEDRRRIRQRLSSAYEKKITILEKRLKGLPALKKAYQDLLVRTKRDQGGIKTMVEAARREASDATKRLRAMAVRAEQAEARQREAVQAGEALREELSLARQLYDKKSRDTMAYLRERSSMKDRIRDLEKQLHDREQAKQESRLEFDSALSELGQVQARLENVSREKEEAHRRLSEAVMRDRASKQRVSELEARLAEAREGRSQAELEARSEGARAGRGLLEDQRARDLEIERNGLRKALDEKEKMVAEVLRKNIILERQVKLAQKELRIAYGAEGIPSSGPPHRTEDHTSAFAESDRTSVMMAPAAPDRMPLTAEVYRSSRARFGTDIEQ